jgi:alpha-L-fucosidase
MSEFEENNPAQLREFLRRLNELVDEFHPNIYLLDKVFNGVLAIEIAVLDELNK